MNKHLTLAILVMVMTLSMSANADSLVTEYTYFGGPYVGVHGVPFSSGTHKSVSSTDYGYSTSEYPEKSGIRTGVEVGARGGYNWLVPVNLPTMDRVALLLLGLELNGSYGGPEGSTKKTTTGTDYYSKDGDEVDFTSTYGESHEMTWNAQLRLRAGMLVNKDIAIYAFGGPVIAGVEETSSYESTYSDGENYGSKSSWNQFAFGYIVGGGAEWKVTHRLSLLAEIAYRDLSVENSDHSYSGSLGSKDETDLSDTSIILGVNLSF